jgi:hypothetical protein
MAQEYEYHLGAERDSGKFFLKVNQLGRQGWKIIHYSAEGGPGPRAVMEISKPPKQEPIQ